MILINPFIEDWEAIRRRKQQLIDKNNWNENKITNRIFIEYMKKY